MGGVVRTVLVGLGVLLMLAGLAIMVGAPDAWWAGLEALGFGAFFVIVVAIERGRYRSAAAEPANLPVGPGGGEPAGEKLEPRFRLTAEAFVDPTTGVSMRVAVDPATGERRYVTDAGRG